MAQDNYNPINYATGKPNPTPFIPGSEFVPEVPETQGKDDGSESVFRSERDEAYMKKQMGSKSKETCSETAIRLRKSS